eukprot:2233305-Lingulodinium_polyedra.AAC.1
MQRATAYVQLAALKADHGGSAGRPPRVKRRRSEVKRGLGRPLAREAAQAAAALRPRPAGPPPPAGLP